MELRKGSLRATKRVKPAQCVKVISAAILSLALVFSIPGVVCASDTLASPPPQSETPIVLWQAQQLAAVSGAEPSAPPSDPTAFPEDESSDSSDEEAGANQSIADPLEPVNRAFFHFNDKLYFWVLKPVGHCA